ncbi:MAG: beta-ribofuranosylaminobenzene 5'-phosphate synthase family protein [Acetobacteraceae bacterium]
MANAMPNIVGEVRVACAARLHLGFLDLHGGLGRRFGSIGLALDEPLTRLVLRRAETTIVRGPERERAAHFLAITTDHLRLPGAHMLEVEQAVPSHVGLGSGTQLALGVAGALRRLHGIPADPRADASLLGRGARSGIGIGLFEQGGLVVDGGHGAGAASPPLLARMAVPDSWRILLLLDHAREGFSGQREKDAFAGLRPMSAAASAEICRLLLMQALPGVAEDDLAAFGAAITRMQEIAGDHFAVAQGGRFTSPAVAASLKALNAAGAVGIGQSSWGPTGFAFARGDAEAARLAAIPRAEPIEIMIRRTRNRGADVTTD